MSVLDHVVNAYQLLSGLPDNANTIVGLFNGHLSSTPAESAHGGLLRRAVTWSNTPQPSMHSGFPGEPEGAPNGRFAVVVVTGLVGIAVIGLLNYTMKVILTLAAVESPPAIYLPLGAEDLLNERNRKPAAVLGITTQGAYVTGSIRGTVKHLRTQAGALALFRGWNANLFYVLAVAVLRTFLTGVFGSFLPMAIARPVAGVLGFVALTRFAMTCTHIVISKPESKTWVTRLSSTPWSTARRSLPAMAHFALTNVVASECYYYAARLQMHPAAKTVVFLVSLVLTVFVNFPAMVALIRVQASLLPDSQEAIVAFDRSFGKSEEMASISFGEALRSVGCAGWKRMYKLAAKIFVVMAAVMVVVVGVVGLEMVWVLAGVPKKAEGFEGAF